MTIESLLLDLGHSNPQYRREALAELQKCAAGFLPPGALSALHKAATSEADPALRRTAEVAFLTQLWRFHDFRRAIPLLESASEEERGQLVATPKPAEAAAPKLLPIVARALDVPAQRRVALRLLEPLQRFSAPVDFALVKLLDYLEDPTWRTASAEVLRRLSLPLAAHRDRFVRLIDSRDAAARSIGAGFLVRIALIEQDASTLLRLVRHDDPTVREFAVGEVHSAARANVDVSIAVTSLGVALGDQASGVVYHALRALLAATVNGVELGDALPAVTRQLSRSEYDFDGWVAPLSGLERAQVRRESPAIDAVRTLIHHYLTRVEPESIEALLAREDLAEATLLAAHETISALTEVPRQRAP